MTEALGTKRREPSVGALLQSWRKARNLSQLGLATQADVSSRHLCFVETGRANPSREMVLRLAMVLDVPLRERNALLLAAGFAPVYTESRLEAPVLAAVNGALNAILGQQEPFPAVVMNRHWDIIRTNEAATRFFGFLLEKRKTSGPANVLRMMFHPHALRPFVRNWNAVAESLVQRVRREAVGGIQDEVTQKLLAEVLDYPDVPRSLRDARGDSPVSPVVPVVFEKAGDRFDFFSAVTTLGTPQDITVQEVRIESFFPVDDATARAARRLATKGS
ncbi:MAG TPA: helix-turn-helix transcriptional regulator [Polyangiaceae bacterium]|jgi:transcriptional regulator with XRE-family HTH domain|nr:helix-turn-helix transcriptional regulator [Polyangiaceae bacterium]